MRFDENVMDKQLALIDDEEQDVSIALSKQ